MTMVSVDDRFHVSERFRGEVPWVLMKERPSQSWLVVTRSGAVFRTGITKLGFKGCVGNNREPADRFIATGRFSSERRCFLRALRDRCGRLVAGEDKAKEGEWSLCHELITSGASTTFRRCLIRIAPGCLLEQHDSARRRTGVTGDQLRTTMDSKHRGIQLSHKRGEVCSRSGQFVGASRWILSLNRSVDDAGLGKAFESQRQRP